LPESINGHRHVMFHLFCADLALIALHVLSENCHQRTSGLCKGFAGNTPDCCSPHIPFWAGVRNQILHRLVARSAWSSVSHPRFACFKEELPCSNIEHQDSTVPLRTSSSHVAGAHCFVLHCVALHRCSAQTPRKSAAGCIERRSV
jgi:hypothetical protein